MAEINGNTTYTKMLLHCPACDKPVNATFHIELAADSPPVAEGAGREVSVEIKGRLAGAQFEHDCIPRRVR